MHDATSFRPLLVSKPASGVAVCAQRRSTTRCGRRTLFTDLGAKVRLSSLAVACGIKMRAYPTRCAMPKTLRPIFGRGQLRQGVSVDRFVCHTLGRRRALACIFRMEHWHYSLGCSILLSMPLEEPPDDRLTHTQARKSHPVRWGFLQQAVARHGVVTSRLVVYPPDTSDHERLWADRLHGFAPLALGGGTLCWLLLIALGVSPETSAIAIVCLLSPAGIYLWRKARSVRSREVSVWANRLGLCPHPDDERREAVITRLSSVMQAACDDVRRGLITREAFERVWISVYMDAVCVAAAQRSRAGRSDFEDSL